MKNGIDVLVFIGMFAFAIIAGWQTSQVRVERAETARWRALAEQREESEKAAWRMVGDVVSETGAAKTPPPILGGGAGGPTFGTIAMPKGTLVGRSRSSDPPLFVGSGSEGAKGGGLTEAEVKALLRQGGADGPGVDTGHGTLQVNPFMPTRGELQVTGGGGSPTENFTDYRYSLTPEDRARGWIAIRVRWEAR